MILVSSVVGWFCALHRRKAREQEQWLNNNINMWIFAIIMVMLNDDDDHYYYHHSDGAKKKGFPSELMFVYQCSESEREKKKPTKMITCMGISSRFCTFMVKHHLNE